MLPALSLNPPKISVVVLTNIPLSEESPMAGLKTRLLPVINSAGRGKIGTRPIFRNKRVKKTSPVSFVIISLASILQ